ncbi:MAG: endopeptidase La [Rivularia sp. (in: cyanobacteria)]
MNNNVAKPLDGISKKVETSLMLPSSNVVVLPEVSLPMTLTDSYSIGVVEAALLSNHKQLVVATIRPEIQWRFDKDKNAEIESLDDIYPVATLATVDSFVRLPVGMAECVFRGLERVKIEKLQVYDHICEVKFNRLPKLSQQEISAKIATLVKVIKSNWEEIAALNCNNFEQVLIALTECNEPSTLAYQTGILVTDNIEILQSLLEEESLEQLLKKVLEYSSKEVKTQRSRFKIVAEMKKEINQQQTKLIESEWNFDDNVEIDEIEDLKMRLRKAGLPPDIRKQAQRELARLKRLGNNPAEGDVIRTYLDWLLEIPWNKIVEVNLELNDARVILDTDHHGLNKVKDRIIEHLATFKLKQAIYSREKQSSQISVGTVLCFVGPPGVGKTSMGNSIARTLNRPFERVSLGGLRDEAELRGHRRTYVGAMPGRIIQALHRCGVKNPVIMLDELDKVGKDSHRGDPASVLLEVLDPQQNSCFRDLYLDCDFDLSQIFFIATANNLSEVPAPLLDRLEIIEISGYSETEKLAIAQKHLLPRQIEKAGLPNQALQLSPQTINLIIENYTREAGVRQLEQQLGSLCRKVAVRHASGNTEIVVIYPEELEELLGARNFLASHIQKLNKPGVACGLAWTVAGGEVLFVEVIKLPQSKDFVVTGHLGEVMIESARIAYDYIWSNAEILGININLFITNGLHIHIPAGSVPKDGSSAGATIVTAIASLLMNRPVRTDTAMSGEIDLSGEILPIGGVREKILAANRIGIKRVILPTANQQDLVDIPKDDCQNIEFIFCDCIEQVLENAFVQDNA